MRRAAVWNENLNDTDVISYIAKHDKSIDVREAASGRLKRMREQELERMKETRLQEVQKMKDPAALANIAKTDGSRDIRSAAIQNRHLTDQTVFAHIAKYDRDEHVRVSAIRRITDAAVLDTVKEACCKKDNHIWRSPTRAISSEEAMQLHFDRLSVYECVICGLEKEFPD